MPEPNWEPVYTENDWYDGPRLGIADYNGHPHLYESRWDKAKDYWEGEGDDENYLYHYWLSPVSPENFALALEDWAIWQRWDSAFRQEKTDQSTHPALPEDRTRHIQLKPLLAQFLKAGQPDAFRVAGKFDVRGVRWAQAADSSERACL